MEKPYKIGDLLFTNRGIAVINGYYSENGIEKIQIRLYITDSLDGVTALGQSLLMSTDFETLNLWSNCFYSDIEERRKNLRRLASNPINREKFLSKLENIKSALEDGPKII